MRALIALAPFALIAACAGSGPAVDGITPASVDATVQLTPTLKFQPGAISIKAGDTVEFSNISAFTHTVSTEPKDASQAKDTLLPPGAEAFDSGPIAPGGVYTHTFTIPGTYKYFCDPHHGQGMIGTIIVAP